VLHAFNSHRGRGGSDATWAETIRLSVEAGVEVSTFSRDSRSLAGVGGKVKAFASGVYAADAVREFTRALAEFRPDVVHTHELYPMISPWILPRCRAAGVAVVHSCYDYRLTCPTAVHYRDGEICDRCLGGREYWAVLSNCRENLAESLAYGLRSWVARKAGLFMANVDQFVVYADYSRAWLERELAVPPERITVNPCSVPAPATAADPGAGDYIAFAGRFAPEKGVELLVEAARRTGLPVKLAGNAASHPAVRPGDPVECVLTPAREDLMNFYRGARMLVAPSRWREVFGLVAAEAMTHGVPVIAANVGGLGGVVVDEETGLLFEPDDLDQLVRHMLRLWGDPELCRRMGAAGRARALSEFAPEKHARRTLEAYDAALRRRGHQLRPSITSP
jgi:glycosyltransferase involved in cell wall biosynthesis